MKNIDVLCIGVVLADLLFGPVKGDVFLKEATFVENMNFTTGGDALNQGIILSRLGKNVGLIGHVGKDLLGRCIINTCQENAIDHSGLIKDSTVNTRINVVLIKEDGQRHFIKTMNNSFRSFRKDEIDYQLIKNAKAVSLASLFSSKLSDKEVIYSILKMAKDNNAITFADTVPFNVEKPLDFLKEALPYVDFMLPNIEEAQLLTGKKKVEEMAEILLDYGVKNVIIKMGKEGCFIKNQGEEMFIPSIKAKTIDTTGAGDNFVAGFIASVLDGKDIKACGQYANEIAGRSTEHVGAI